jgi:hypothetical protein
MTAAKSTEPKPRASSHAEAARRLRDLAVHFSLNPDQARDFRLKSGICDEHGQLTAAYR